MSLRPTRPPSRSSTETAAFDWPLPAEAIAQTPAEPRDSARLLVSMDPGDLRHLRVSDLPALICPGDTLVVNHTRVMPARLRLRKSSGGAAEVLLLAPIGPGEWSALVRPGRRLPPGTRLQLDGQDVVEVGGDHGEGRRVRMLQPLPDVMAAGEVPLPPYITAPLDDDDRYQTVFARPEARSVAAPTAGLHLTDEVLDRCRSAGAEVAMVDLTVGPATFKPIETTTVEAHRMHSEAYVVPPETVEACQRAQRVVAVGTTTVRALESAACGSLDGDTSLFIRPGFDFQMVDVLLTNFHMPRSSLLVMLEAFVGPRWRDLYGVAVNEGYRFLSFGDAMLIGRQ